MFLLPKLKKLTGLLFTLFLLLAPFSPSNAAPPSNLEDPQEHSAASSGEKLALAGFFPAAMNTLDVLGNYAYVGAGASLLVIDVSDPDNPRQVAYRQLPAVAHKLVATTGRIYILTDNLVLIVDISRPAAPYLAGQFKIGDTYTYTDLDADGERFFLNYAGGFSILDASNPNLVKLISTLPLPATYIPEVFKVYGKRAFAVLNSYINAQLIIVDVSNPSRPTIIGQPLDLHATQVIFTGLVVSGDLVAIAKDDNFEYDYPRIDSINISDPDHMYLTSEISLGPLDRNPMVAIQGHYLYGATRNGQISIFDITDPASPLESGYIQTKTRSMMVSGSQVYVASGGDGFAIYDIGDPANPIQRGTLPAIGLPRDVAIQGDILYVSDGGVSDYYYDLTYGGLAILNVQEPDSISVIHKVSSASSGNQITMVNNQAFLTEGNCYFNKGTTCSRQISGFDITNPSSVTTLFTLDLTGDYDYFDSPLPGPIALQDQTAYVANTSQGLSILDYGNLALLGHFPHNSTTPPGVTGIAVTGTYALVSSQTYQDTSQPSLQVVDVSNPMTPTILSETDMNDPHQITLAGSLAFLADGSAGLKILDISHLPQVTVLGALDTPGTALDVAYDGHYAYVADGGSGLRMIDVSDPSKPLEVDAFDTGGQAANVTVAGAYIYLADESGGLLVFSVVKPQAYLSLLMH